MEDDDPYCDDWEDDPCDHDDYDVDLLAGRACCYRCGEAWWLSNEQLKKETEWASGMWAEQVFE